MVSFIKVATYEKKAERNFQMTLSSVYVRGGAYCLLRCISKVGLGLALIKN